MNNQKKEQPLTPVALSRLLIRLTFGLMIVALVLALVEAYLAVAIVMVVVGVVGIPAVLLAETHDGA